MGKTVPVNPRHRTLFVPVKIIHRLACHPACFAETHCAVAGWRLLQTLMDLPWAKSGTRDTEGNSLAPSSFLAALDWYCEAGASGLGWAGLHWQWMKHFYHR